MLRDQEPRELSEDPLTEEELQAFLDRPFHQIEVVSVADKPSREMLRWMPTLSDEVGMYRIVDYWTAIKASEIGIPSWLVPNHCDVFLHSHPRDENDQSEADSAVPSLGDYLHSVKHGRNLITSTLGITTFAKPNDYDLESRIRLAIERNEFGVGSQDRYDAFLAEHGLSYAVFPWDEIDDSLLSRLLGDTTD